MNVLLAVDGSEYTKRMLAYVAKHEGLLGPTHDYTAVTVIAAIPPHAARHIDRNTLADYYRDEAGKVLDPLKEVAAQRGFKVQTLYRHGHASDEIAELAHTGNYDLIVMGTHGYSALGNLVLGSVVTGVLARSHAPVLLVP
jgi:nucleotide-binding universal stress UspA family protein